MKWQLEGRFEAAKVVGSALDDRRATTSRSVKRYSPGTLLSLAFGALPFARRYAPVTAVSKKPLSSAHVVRPPFSVSALWTTHPSTVPRLASRSMQRLTYAFPIAGLTSLLSWLNRYHGLRLFKHVPPLDVAGMSSHLAYSRAHT